MPISDYERRRQANIADNKRVLAALGLLDPLKDRPTLELILNLKKRKTDIDDDDEPQPPKKRVKKEKVVLSEVTNSNETELGSISGQVRRSARRLGKAVNDDTLALPEDADTDHANKKTKLKVLPKRENFYGAVPGIEVGTAYETRMEFCVVGVHRPTVAGIYGGPDGAYSIALSGGYEDDIDRGEFFTYTGEGGRDLKGTAMKPKNLRTAPQSKDQTLSKGNLALKRSVETKNPVRVIRGYKLKSPYAPSEGYRYDGLYTVEKAWYTTGLSGFGVWKFAMKRCADQAPPPWTYITDEKLEADLVVDTPTEVVKDVAESYDDSESDKEESESPKNNEKLEDNEK
jgi:hypothetical protein